MFRKMLITAACAAAACGSTVMAGDRGGDKGGVAGTGIPPLTTIRVAQGLSLPTQVMAPAGEPNRLWICEKAGVIKILQFLPLSVLPTPFLDINSLVINPSGTNDERGLLGLAFDPNYFTNGYFYVHYINNSQVSTIARYTVQGNPTTSNVADPASARIILTQSQPFSNHNGGWIGFGPDGYLYISFGDGGSQNDPNANGQNLNTWLAKILRVDVNGDDFPADPNRNYAIPPTNPFAGPTAGLDEIWAYGLRNPWRCSFDRLTGDFWIADVGQGTWEEVNVQPASSAGGVNYGWRCYEGPNAFNTTGCGPQSSMTFPVYSYNHGSGCSITGGYVYRGCTMPELQGTYFFADYCSNSIWSFSWSAAGGVTNFQNRTTELDPAGAIAISSISSFGEDGLGEMYIVEHGGGELFRIIPGTGYPAQPDCNSNNRPDACDIVLGISQDTNGNGIPDECEKGPCVADLNGDGSVGPADLGMLLGSWGDPGCGGSSPCSADLNGDGVVGPADLGAMLGSWGPC